MVSPGGSVHHRWQRRWKLVRDGFRPPARPFVAWIVEGMVPVAHGLERWDMLTAAPHRLKTALRMALRWQIKRYLNRYRLRNVITGDTIEVRRLLAFEIKHYFEKEIHLHG